MSYTLARWLVGALFRVAWRPTVEGARRIPRTGPVIIASNHLSFSDSFFLPLVVPRPITFLAKSDYFTGRGVKGMFTKAFFAGVGQVPVDRSGGRASEAALRTGSRILGEGSLLGIYPEGTRSPNGTLYRGKTGLARMAMECEVPILPVAIATSRFKRLNNWDRSVIHLPFGRGVIAAGEIIWVPPDADTETMQTLRLQLEERLNEVTRRAYQLVGRTDEGLHA